jgi:hypothetical protein
MLDLIVTSQRQVKFKQKFTCKKYFGRTNTDPITLPKILLKSRSEKKKKDLIMLYNTSNKQNKTKKNEL